MDKISYLMLYESQDDYKKFMEVMDQYFSDYYVKDEINPKIVILITHRLNRDDAYNESSKITREFKYNPEYLFIANTGFNSENFGDTAIGPDAEDQSARSIFGRLKKSLMYDLKNENHNIPFIDFTYVGNKMSIAQSEIDVPTFLGKKIPLDLGLKPLPYPGRYDNVDVDNYIIIDTDEKIEETRENFKKNIYRELKEIEKKDPEISNITKKIVEPGLSHHENIDQELKILNKIKNKLMVLFDNTNKKLIIAGILLLIIGFISTLIIYKKEKSLKIAEIKKKHGTQ